MEFSLVFSLDLPACSIVPQPTIIPRAPRKRQATFNNAPAEHEYCETVIADGNQLCSQCLQHQNDLMLQKEFNVTQLLQKRV
jgi:hypothetical protein